MLLFRSVCIVCMCYVVSACGFQPLYGSTGDANAIANFSEIRVAPAKDRIGQLFTNELKHLLNPLREPIKPTYRLTSKITESTTSLAVKKSSLATRANLIATVNYNLISTRNGHVVSSGSNKITVSYNIYSAEYATLAAEKDARKRAVTELAQDTRLQLGAFFKNAAQTTAQ